MRRRRETAAVATVGQLPAAPSCGACRFADPTVLPMVDGCGPMAVLLCRRYPPAPVVEDEAISPAWPLVQEQEWCGEYGSGSAR